MRILHVEDDEDTRRLVEFILHGKGWQVVSVENATSALRLAEAGAFDLYLIDNWIEGDTRNAAVCVLSIHTLRYFSIPVRCFRLTSRRRSRPAHRDTSKSPVLLRHSLKRY
jgi:CheY-like chemotaxis protein